MKKIILTVFLITLWTSNILAQSSEFNIQQVKQYENGSLLLSEDLLGIFNDSPLIASLQDLATDASQIARIVTQGNENTVYLTQNGFNNIGIIQIDGSHNNSSLNQTGNGLLSAINIEGNYNDLSVDQRGSALQNMILLSGNGLEYDILQNNDGIRLTQTGSSIPLQISSTGRSIPIMISNR